MQYRRQRAICKMEFSTLVSWVDAREVATQRSRHHARDLPVSTPLQVPAAAALHTAEQFAILNDLICPSRFPCRRAVIRGLRAETAHDGTGKEALEAE